MILFKGITLIEKGERRNSREFNNILDGAPIIFQDDLKKDRLFDVIKSFGAVISGRTMTDDSYAIALSILGHESNHVSDEEEYLPPGTKGKVLSEVKNKLYDLDFQQEAIGKTIAPGPQRIRGIAGSGKTLLICQKAAYMHLKYPDWKIAITFFTQSLYDIITKNVDMYLRAFSNGEVSYKANGNLQILHAWGNKRNNGLYREIASKNNVEFLDVNAVNYHFAKKFVPIDISINYIAKSILEQKEGKLKEIYDVILIDEGQDLVGDDELKYNGKQPFYYMAYKSLKPISNDEPNLRRLIWAYDELQSLNGKKIPSGKELFDDENLVVGKYKGGTNKSEVMKRCYRTPNDILTAAHAIGMGFFREEGMITGYTTKKDWENIGYTVLDGNFKRDGNIVKMERKKENSTNPIHEFFKGSCIEFKTYNSHNDLEEELVRDIKNDIEIQKLDPSRDILVVSLKDGYNGKKYVDAICSYMKAKGINYYVPSMDSMNKLSCNRKEADRFWFDGAVTVSNINRAKGNEAAMVYVIGLEDVAQNEDSVEFRNQLFVALTRAKCWVKVMGVGEYEFYEEFNKAINANGKFEFKFIRPKNNADDLEVKDNEENVEIKAEIQ